MVILGNLFFEEAAVQLVARLADGEASSVLVENLDFLVVEVVTAVVQHTRAMEVVVFDVFEGGVAETDGRQATITSSSSTSAKLSSSDGSPRKSSSVRKRSMKGRSADRLSAACTSRARRKILSNRLSAAMTVLCIYTCQYIRRRLMMNFSTL